MDFNKSLIRSLEDNAEYKGVNIETSSSFNKRFFNIYEEQQEDSIRTYIRADYLDSDMFLYHFTEMLKENKINISFNENATEKDINYFEKLSKSFMNIE